MPGRVEQAEAGRVVGWARHPVHPAYPMTVHLLHQGVVAATSLAEPAGPDRPPGFALAVPAGAIPSRCQVMLGETGTELALPGAGPGPSVLRVEDLLARRAARPWLDGTCHIDAALAGMGLVSIVELLCQDHLGEPPAPPLLRACLSLARKDGADAVRRFLIHSPYYRARRIYADRAPGGIFAQTLVRSVAARDADATRLGDVRLIEVSAHELLALDGAVFIATCYRRLLAKEVDPEGLTHYMARMAQGDPKAAIIRHLGNELESIRAGIVVVDLPDDE